ncbi:MAG: hypothetical protein ACPL4K_03060 [Candidatus Margulisiibacteriota bacterium]
MVNKINFVSSVGIERNPGLKSNPKSDKSFMDVLRSEFERVKSSLKEVPGLPGVYSLPFPQTLPDLNVTSKVI